MKNFQVADQENARITRICIGGGIRKTEQLEIFPAQLDYQYLNRHN